MFQSSFNWIFVLVTMNAFSMQVFSRAVGFGCSWVENIFLPSYIFFFLNVWRTSKVKIFAWVFKTLFTMWGGSLCAIRIVHCHTKIIDGFRNVLFLNALRNLHPEVGLICRHTSTLSLIWPFILHFHLWFIRNTNRKANNESKLCCEPFENQPPHGSKDPMVNWVNSNISHIVIIMYYHYFSSIGGHYLCFRKQLFINLY